MPSQPKSFQPAAAGRLEGPAACESSELALTDSVYARLEAHPRVAAEVFIADSAVVLGDVVIGFRSSIWYGCVVRGDVNFIRIGERTNIQDCTVVHATTDGNPTIIGDGVTVGHAAVLHACTIEDEVLIGFGARVLDGATMRAGSMLAAGAVLTPGKVVPAGQLWAGNPAKPLRNLSQLELAGIRVSATRYVALAAHYRSSPPFRH